MAKELVERELGEIKGCLKGIDTGLENLKSENADIFERLRTVERDHSILKQRVHGLEGNFKKFQEDQEREKDRELSRTNLKIAAVGIVLTIVELIIGGIVTLMK